MRLTYAEPVLVLIWGMAVGALLWGSGLDIAAQQWLWVHYNQPFNTVTRVMGEIGKGSVLTALTLLMALLLIMRVRWKMEKQVWLVLAALPVMGLASLLNVGLKWLAGRPRPKEFLMYGGDPWLAKPMQGDSTWWSFPSGHSCSVAAWAVWMALVMPDKKGILLGLAVILAMSRFMAVTPHYPGDVVAGAALGAAVSLAAWRWAEGRRYV